MAYFGLNLLMIWPIVDMMPHPLGDGDRTFLAKMREVTEYARRERGFEIWMGAAANTMIHGDGGVPVERREHDTRLDLRDPTDPAGLARLLANREELYRILDNADFY